MRRDTSWRMLLAAYLFLLMPWAAQADWEQVGAAGFSAGQAWYTSLAFDSSGTPYVAYRDDANGLKASVMRFNGTAWEQVGTAGFGTGYTSYTSLVLDSSDRPYIAYVEPRNGAISVMRFNGGSWEQVGAPYFTSTYGLDNQISLALDSSGTPYIAYPNNSCQASVMRFNGTDWEQVGTPGISEGEAHYISLALDSSDTSYIAYMDIAHVGDNNRGGASVMRFNGTSWEQVGMARFSAGIAGPISFALDSTDTPYIAYADGATGWNTSVMRFNGTSWEQVGMAGFSSGGRADYVSMVLDSSGRPYVAYITNRYTVGSKASAMRFNGAGWEQVGKAGFSVVGGEFGQVSLALDHSSTPYIAYSDAANGGKASVMKFVPPVLTPIYKLLLR